MSFGTLLRIALWGGMLAAAYVTAGLFSDPFADPEEAPPSPG